MQIGGGRKSGSHGDAAALLQAVFLMACFISRAAHCMRRGTDSNNNYCASLQVTRNKSRRSLHDPRWIGAR